MYLDYIKERYGEGLDINWKEYLEKYQLAEYATPQGFITYKPQGDAMLIYDMYVKPAFRKHTHAWVLHNHVRNLGEDFGKRVMITFSDFKGKNHIAGIKAMKVAGFVPAFKTNEEFVFIKGI